jgi:hypothetical protein
MADPPDPPPPDLPPPATPPDSPPPDLPPPATPPDSPPPPGGDRSPSAPPPPDDLDGEFDRVTARRRWPVVVVGLAVVAALVASSLLARSAGSGDSGPGDGGGATAPTTTGEPATRAEVEAAVAAISTFVEQERGLDFVEPVEVDLAGEGEFQDRLLADFDEDVDELRATGAFLEGLGMVEPGTDVVEAMRSLLGGFVVGFYDPETAELVVRGAELTPYVKTTIAHELVHALDDQHHDLDRPEYDDADDEVGFGFSAVAEGNARRIESAYRASLDEDERAQADAQERAVGGDVDLGAVPLVLLDLIGAPYLLGEPFVERVVDDGGNEALAEAFADPPRTTEQVLDPDRYLAGEEAVDVPAPDVAGEVVDEGVVGQLVLMLMLAGELGMDDARAAATGWGGDRGVAWRDGDRACATVSLVGDDGAETRELRAAVDRWAGEQDDARVVAGRGDGPFTFESCSG